MLHSRKDYNHIQDKTGKIDINEPVFILRAKDKLAPEVVMKWADYLEAEGGDEETIEIAREHASIMLQWQEENGCKLPNI